jgi:hypothetical protein
VQKKHQYGRRAADEEQHPPCGRRRQQREQQGIEQGRGSPADRPAGLHEAQRFTAMLRPHGLAQQYRPGRPFAAKAQSHEGPGRQQLLEIAGQAGQQGEGCEPQNGNLQNAHAAVTIRAPASQPAAHGRHQQRCGTNHAGLPARQAPDRDQRGNDEAVDLDVHRVQRPAADGRREGAALVAGQLSDPGEHRYGVDRMRQANRSGDGGF